MRVTELSGIIDRILRVLVRLVLGVNNADFIKRHNSVKRPNHYHRLEREHVHLTLLDEALRRVEDVNTGKVLSAAKLKACYGR